MVLRVKPCIAIDTLQGPLAIKKACICQIMAVMLFRWILLFKQASGPRSVPTFIIMTD